MELTASLGVRASTIPWCLVVARTMGCCLTEVLPGSSFFSRFHCDISALTGALQIISSVYFYIQKTEVLMRTKLTT